MENSLVPANTKKSLLVLGFLRPLPDLLILVVGILISVSLLAFLGNTDTIYLILYCIPMLVCGFLVMPLPNYHNTLCAIQSILSFYNNRRNFIWKGWSIYNEYKDK